MLYRYIVGCAGQGEAKNTNKRAPNSPRGVIRKNRRSPRLPAFSKSLPAAIAKRIGTRNMLATNILSAATSIAVRPIWPSVREKTPTLPHSRAPSRTRQYPKRTCIHNLHGSHAEASPYKSSVLDACIEDGAYAPIFSQRSAGRALSSGPPSTNSNGHAT